MCGKLKHYKNYKSYLSRHLSHLSWLWNFEFGQWLFQDLHKIIEIMMPHFILMIQKVFKTSSSGLILSPPPPFPPLPWLSGPQCPWPPWRHDAVLSVHDVSYLLRCAYDALALTWRLIYCPANDSVGWVLETRARLKISRGGKEISWETLCGEEGKVLPEYSTKSTGKTLLWSVRPPIIRSRHWATEQGRFIRQFFPLFER